MALHAVGQHRRLRVISAPGSKRRQLARPRGRGPCRRCARRARRRPSTSSRCASVSGSTHHAELLGPLGHAARQARQREDVVALVVERRRRRQARGAAARQEVDGLACDRRRSSSSARAACRGTARAAAPGLTTAPESWCAPSARPFSSTLIGTSPSCSASAGSSPSSWPRRIAQASPAGPPPTIATPQSMRRSARAVGLLDVVLRARTAADSGPGWCSPARRYRRLRLPGVGQSRCRSRRRVQKDARA